MPADRIEREIDIDAPIDVVWAVITEPEHITGWFTDSAELDLRQSGKGRFGWDVKATNRKLVVNLRVERLDPPNFFSFRWHYPDGDEPSEANAPLVEFSLEARGDSTRLRLVESGLEKIARSDEAKATYLAEHASGWTSIVERLRDYAPKQRSTVAG
ncbi:MAG: hypothetical protein QOH15_1203 [Gaiellales bacterium]|nr:hypothetical protein [Gaiellales bacterium]